ncbi:MAG: flagellar M-ring protein FliF [Chloroflexi bacterium]|nr:flagellar M-ring protein FliF [Chloroflexota bacterium]
MLNRLRQQLLDFWGRQTRGQRLLLITLVAAGAIAIGLFTAWASTPTYAVAFSGLSEADAGQIVEKLAADDIPYKVDRNSTILVPSDQVYEVRLAMARQGLPQGGTVGFELFSGTTLGMTEFTQRVNYQRALEGELERTIGSLQAVQAVRVHIVAPEKALLASEQSPTTASVTLHLKPGASLDAAQVRAITHLVASSVEGLKPENVVVLDVEGNLLAGGADGPGSAASASDSRRAAEAAYAAQIQSRVRNLLDNVLGPNKSVVQASVAMDWSQKDVTTQGFDPAGTIRSSQTITETFVGDAGAVGGIPGAAANLPDLSASKTITDTQTSQYQRLENTTNYEITQVESHEVVAPGRVERISLSVLVDGVTDTQQLTSLRAAVVAAAGIDETRGDTLAVESLAFDRTYYAQQTAEMKQASQTDLYFKIGTGVGALLLLAALLWYVQRLLANLRLASAEIWTPIQEPAAQAALAAPARAGLQPPAAGSAVAAAAQVRARLPAATARRPTAEDEQLQRAVVRIAEQDPSTVTEIIHLWLKEDEAKHV